jgi:Ubiquitin carboxyl-terminal hydrolase, family 1
MSLFADFKCVRDHWAFARFGQRLHLWNLAICQVLIHIYQSDVTIAPESPLAKFIEQAMSRTPLERAELLEKTELFVSIHASAANSGQSDVPTNLDTELHFCTFVQAPSPVDKKLHLLELDGRRVGPVDRGPCDDLLTVCLLPMILSIFCIALRAHHARRMLPKSSGTISSTFKAACIIV